MQHRDTPGLGSWGTEGGVRFVSAGQGCQSKWPGEQWCLCLLAGCSHRSVQILDYYNLYAYLLDFQQEIAVSLTICNLPYCVNFSSRRSLGKQALANGFINAPLLCGPRGALQYLK